MGDESINLERTRFDLSDLGLLSGETERGIRDRHAERRHHLAGLCLGLLPSGCSTLFGVS